MIFERNGKWCVAVYDPTLKRKRWVGTFASSREARRAEREASQKRMSLSRITCAEFVELWLSDYARDAPATRRTYKYALKGFKKDFDRFG